MLCIYSVLLNIELSLLHICLSVKCYRNTTNWRRRLKKLALIGNIGSFDSAIDQWSSYKERLDQFFTANDVDSSKHVAVLLSVIGGKTYELLRTLTSPEKPAQKTFDDLCDILSKHLNPRPLIIAERFRFHKRNQKQGESISEYCVAIQKLAEHCQFGTTLNDALRDRLVCGLTNEHIQRKLLVEADLNYEKAKAIAIASETATKDAEELRKQPNSDVNKLKAKPDVKHAAATARARSPLKSTSAAYCTRCGKKNHSQAECYFRDKECHNCSKRGHTKKMCRSKITRHGINIKKLIMLTIIRPAIARRISDL